MLTNPLRFDSQNMIACQELLKFKGFYVLTIKFIVK